MDFLSSVRSMVIRESRRRAHLPSETLRTVWVRVGHGAAGDPPTGLVAPREIPRATGANRLLQATGSRMIVEAMEQRTPKAHGNAATQAFAGHTAHVNEVGAEGAGLARGMNIPGAENGAGIAIADVRSMLFLMAECVKGRGLSRAEQRRRMMAAYMAIKGTRRVSANVRAAIDRELAK